MEHAFFNNTIINICIKNNDKIIISLQDLLGTQDI